MKEHSSLVVSEYSLATKNATNGRKLLAVLALSLGLTLAVVWLLGAGLRVARAASFTVNTTADDYNGSCAGTCSLRDAIVRANQNGQRNTISLGSGTYVLTRTGAAEDAGLTGDLDITSTQPITIEGVGAGQTIINANGIDRVLDIHSGAGTVVISGVTIYNGNAGIAKGGGIRDADADLMLINTVVVSNSANYGGGVYVDSGSATVNGGQIVSNTAIWSGGGVYVYSGTVTLSGGQIVSNTAHIGDGGGVYVSGSTAIFTQTGVSTITLNTAGNDGGGVNVDAGSASLSGGQMVSNTAGGSGGGVYVSSGSATLSAEQIVNNTATIDGGGVYVWSGAATLSGGQIVSNTASDYGGGVCVYGSSATFTQTGLSNITHNTADDGGGVYVWSGTATLSGGQIVSNTAFSGGGGIYISAGSAVLSGGQIARNSAPDGGGVYVYSGSATQSEGQIVNNTASNNGGGFYNYSGTLALINSTVSGNHATGSGGGLFRIGGTSVLTYTTIASNTATGGAGGINTVGGTVLVQDTIIANNATNCNTGLTSNGHNLEDGHTCGLATTGDMTDTDPLLGPLTADGGSLVHPLLAGSAAIDHGVCIAGITTDQRGVTRPQGSTCDIGAYEKAWRKVYLPLILRSSP